MKPPTKAETVDMLRRLIDGSVTRKTVSVWAEPWVIAGNIEDKSVWDALTKLGMADLISTDRPYLYMEVDFKMWLEELQGSK